MKHTASPGSRAVLVVLAIVLASASATAAPIFVVALGKSVDLPEGWKVAEDAGERGMAFDAPTGERIEIAVWKPQLAAGEVLDAKRVAWEHLILLRRSCNFIPATEQKLASPLSPHAERVSGRADVDGKTWAGAFLACVLEGGRACVIGCFAPTDPGGTHSFALIDQLASAAAGVTAVPPSTLVTGRPGATQESGGATLGTETPAVGGGEGGATPALPLGGTPTRALQPGRRGRSRRRPSWLASAPSRPCRPGHAGVPRPDLPIRW